MEAHQHRFNATVITTVGNPVGRCSCGAWSRLRGPAKRAVWLPGSPLAKGFETRLEEARRPDREITAACAAPPEPARFAGREADTTAAVDDVLRGRRRT